MTNVMQETFGPGADEEEGDVPSTVFRFPPFEGLDVTGARIEIRNVAGGLRDAMDIAPIVLHQGDEFDITLRCKTRGIRHDPVEKDEPDGAQYRTHIVDALRSVIVDQSLAQSEFDAQAERLAERKEIEGQLKLEQQAAEKSAGDIDPDEPFLGYSELTAAEVVERVQGCGDLDADLVDAIEAYEEAHGGRGEILTAIKEWRDL